MSFFDEYLSSVDPPRREALERIRRLVKGLLPEVEEGQSYAMPAMKYHGKALVGFIAARNHLSLFPFSPDVIDIMRPRLEGFDLTKGTIHFSVENPLPDDVVEDIARPGLRRSTRKPAEKAVRWWRSLPHASLAVVLVVAAPPEAGLVATEWRAVEPLVHSPDAVHPALVRRVGVVYDAILERERAHAGAFSPVRRPIRSNA